MVYFVAHAPQVQLRLCRFLNPGAPELCTDQGERCRYQDLALPAARNYIPEHDAEPLTRQHVLLPKHVSLVSVYVQDAHCFWKGRICGLGQCECDAKSHWVGLPVGAILPSPGLRQHSYYTSCIPDKREDAMRYTLHLCVHQEGCFLAIAFNSVFRQPNRAHHPLPLPLRQHCHRSGHWLWI